MEEIKLSETQLDEIVNKVIDRITKMSFTSDGISKVRSEIMKSITDESRAAVIGILESEIYEISSEVIYKDVSEKIKNDLVSNNVDTMNDIIRMKAEIAQLNQKISYITGAFRKISNELPI